MKEDKKSYSAVIAFVIIVAVVGLVFMNNNKNLNAKEIKELIPEEVINYYYNKEQYTSQVENVNIVRQNTENGNNTTYCEVELKDENITRVVYLCLNSKYYSEGGWHLESWNPYEYEILKDWNNKEEETKKILEHRFEELEYSGLTLNSYEVVNEENEIICKFDYNMNKSYNNLTLSGNLDCNVTFYCKSKTLSANDYPVEYSTNLIIDTTGVKEIWNLDGTWYANLIDSFGESHYRITLKLSDSGNSKIKWEGNAIYDAVIAGTYIKTGEEESYNDSGIFDLSTSVLTREDYMRH